MSFGYFFRSIALRYSLHNSWKKESKAESLRVDATELRGQMIVFHQAGKMKLPRTWGSFFFFHELFFRRQSTI